MKILAATACWLAIVFVATAGTCALCAAMSPVFLIFGTVFFGAFFSPILLAAGPDSP